MADNDPIEITLLAPDLTTKRGGLAHLRADWYLRLNEPGSGNVELSAFGARAQYAVLDSLVEFNYRGARRGAFIVENISKDLASSQDNAGKTVTVSGRGALALLDKVLIGDAGQEEMTRTFTATRAGILITLMTEAQSDGGLSTLTWDFTASADSDSNAWDAADTYTVKVGTSLLDYLRDVAKTGIDFDIQPSGAGFVLSAYKNGIGSNKTESVYLRTGMNCEEVSSEEIGSDIQNVLRVKYKGGITTVSDATSIATYGRREGMLDIEYAATLESALTIANAELAIRKNPETRRQIRLYDNIGKKVFVDFTLGDTVTFDDQGTETTYRIREMHLSFDGDGYATVTLDINTNARESAIRLGQDIDWLKDQWRTARDANLMEVRKWVALTLPDDTIGAVFDADTDGDKVFFVGEDLDKVGGIPDNVSFRYYDMATGTWGTYSNGYLTEFPQCVLAEDGKVWVGVIGGITNHLYEWDGSVWNSYLMVDDLSEVVYALAYDSVANDLYVGGFFASLDSVSDTRQIARFDLDTHTVYPMGSGLGFADKVYALYWDAENSRLIIGGDISAYNNICTWDGANYASLGGGLDGVVRAVTVRDGKIIAGGEQTGYLSEWDGIAWSTVTGAPSGIVRDLKVYLTDLYVAGDFTEGVLKLSGDIAFSLDGGVDAPVSALTLHNQTVIVGGNFTQADSIPVYKIGAYFTSFEALMNQLASRGNAYDLGAGIHGATAVTTPLDADEFPLWKSSVKLLRKVTWANIKATLKNYFDTLYAKLTDWTANRVIISDASGNMTVDDGLAYVAANNRVILGGESLNPLTGDNSFIAVADGASPALFLQTYGSSYAPFITLAKADGSAATPTNVKSGQVIGRIRGRGYDGTGWSNTRSEIRLVASADWSSSSHPIDIEFYTTPSGSTTLTLRMTIYHDGKLWMADDGRVSADNGLAFMRNMERNLVLQDGESLVIAEYLNLGTYDLTLEGDAALHIL